MPWRGGRAIDAALWQLLAIDTGLSALHVCCGKPQVFKVGEGGQDSRSRAVLLPHTSTRLRPWCLA